MSFEGDADPAAFIQFDSRLHAIYGLKGVGYIDADKFPPFTPEELCNEVNSVLKDEGIVIMDMTTAVPDIEHAAYMALTIAGFKAAASCKKDQNAAFLILRTEANTPSFLMGHHWSATQTFGKDVAEERIRKSPTPALVVVFRDRQICLPTSVFETNVSVVSKIIAHEVTMDESFFSCALCSKSFIKRSGDCITIEEMCVHPDGRMFRKECIEMYKSADSKSWSLPTAQRQADELRTRARSP